MHGYLWQRNAPAVRLRVVSAAGRTIAIVQPPAEHDADDVIARPRERVDRAETTAQIVDHQGFVRGGRLAGQLGLAVVTRVTRDRVE
jgi:hypothetical protein